MVVAVFDVAIESQSGRASPKTAALNIMKGLLATAMFSIVPVELYKFCVTLQNTFLSGLGHLVAGYQGLDLGKQSVSVLEGSFKMSMDLNATLFSTLSMIAFAYSVIKIFFANLKRGGILIIQIAVGSLYLFSVPRSYSDGFWQWCKQVAALCLTAFLQTTMLFLGLLTFPDHMILGMGIMLAASEVPRIAQQFGLDTSAKFNLSSVVHMSSTAVNLIKHIK